ncbi:MAG: L-seryl-tRNA(Sec) selenium transferase [Candidatus Cloacimonetes bacterium]|nr:L-seryl-tRNA(Sec) selenium transferase [Candidatus Cloacimonadota bacterium]
MELRIPSVDFIIHHPKIKTGVIQNPHLLKTAVKKYIEAYKRDKGYLISDKEQFIAEISDYLKDLIKSPLKPVINATGIILHTNLGRAPLSKYILENSFKTLSSYSNLEFDLNSGKRGNRNVHLSALIQLLTGAEDCLIVNNNAAAVFLCLNQFARNKEVIVSRSELIEIGGSFRIPDIMTSSGCILKEVGTTNCTRLSDYEENINDQTAMIFKAHQSNYYILGHTESVEIEALSSLAKKNNLPFLYDIGSGLLKQIDMLNPLNEPNVSECLTKGVDLITFSGDKLLGGPQCGIIAGKKTLIDQLATNPLMRVLRVDKLTLSVLHECLALYCDESQLLKHNPLFQMLKQTESELKKRAQKCFSLLKKAGIESKIMPAKACTGGGTLPDLELVSYEVQLDTDSVKAETLYSELMTAKLPVVAILREGHLSFNMMTLSDYELKFITDQLTQLFSKDCK